MAKKSFKMPMLILTGWSGDDGSDTGIGSAGSSPDFTLCDFDEWLEMYGDDYNGDDSISFADYEWWWFKIAKFTQEQWDEVNGDNSNGQNEIIVELFPGL